MKIGIITWYSGTNYGTHLQAIALQWYLRKKGYEVELIKYDKKLTKYQRPFKTKILSQPRKYFLIATSKKYKKEIDIRNQSLKDAITQYCNLSTEIHDVDEFIKCCNTYDIVIVGSDQLWNPNWYSRIYYANYDRIKAKRISYAPSMGVNSIPEEKKKIISESLEKFQAISVREKTGARIIESLGFARPVVVVDPTLLLKASDWISLFPKTKVPIMKKPYALTVFLDDDLRHWKAANSFVKNHGLENVIVPYMGFSYIQKGRIFADAGLNELINLVFHAKFILTDSFHITVFSLIFGKQFYTFERFRENQTTSTNARVRNLLKLADLEQRLLPHGTKKVPLISEIDYQKTFSRLEREILKSEEYLRNAIES